METAPRRGFSTRRRCAGRPSTPRTLSHAVLSRQRRLRNARIGYEPDDYEVRTVGDVRIVANSVSGRWSGFPSRCLFGVVAIQDEARSSAGFQMTSQRWPSGSWKYPE
jgi:hypothetical protein